MSNSNEEKVVSPVVKTVSKATALAAASDAAANTAAVVKSPTPIWVFGIIITVVIGFGYLLVSNQNSVNNALTERVSSNTEAIGALRVDANYTACRIREDGFFFDADAQCKLEAKESK
jgi:hypothetical protein